MGNQWRGDEGPCIHVANKVQNTGTTLACMWRKEFKSFDPPQPTEGGLGGLHVEVRGRSEESVEGVKSGGTQGIDGDRHTDLHKTTRLCKSVGMELVVGQVLGGVLDPMQAHDLVIVLMPIDTVVGKLVIG